MQVQKFSVMSDSCERRLCSLGVRDDMLEAMWRGYEKSHVAKFSYWTEDEGLVELYSQTKIKQKNNADSGRNFGGNNAPSWAFIFSSNRVAGSQRAGFVCQKILTNKQTGIIWNVPSWFKGWKGGEQKPEFQYFFLSAHQRLAGLLHQHSAFCLKMTHWPQCVQNPAIHCGISLNSNRLNNWKTTVSVTSQHETTFESNILSFLFFLISIRHTNMYSAPFVTLYKDILVNKPFW